MTDCEFVIPLKRDDLQVSVEGQYFVTEVLSPEAIHEKLQECLADLTNDGSTFILKHFDLLYSVMVEFSALDWGDVHKIYDKIIFKSVVMLSKFVEQSLDGGMLNSEDRIQALNVVKMTLYIYSQFFQCYMNKQLMKTEAAVTVNVKGRKKRNLNDQHTEEHSWDWEEKQRTGLVRLQIILQLPLCSLWDPPVVEESFVNMISDCCYRALEQSSISLVKSKILRDIIIQILGVLIKQYNHGMSFVVKSVQLLKRFEHVANPLSEAVLKFVNQFGCKSLVKHLLEEILEASEVLSSVTDNHSAKSFSNFLTELAESNPNELVPVLDSVFSFLDCELAALRSLGLCVLTEVLLGCLSQDDAERTVRNNRQKCLNALMDHQLDVNAHIRAKVLQLWQKIVSHGALPKEWIIPLMESTTSRLIDVSSIVTKQAIHLIRLMMETNPFAAMLSLDELTKTLEDETASYNEMKKSKLILLSNNENLWFAVEPELKLFLEEYFKEGSTLKAPPESPDVKKPRIQTINSFVSQRNFSKATNLLIYAEDTLSEFKNVRKAMNMSDVDFYLGVFRSIFLDKQNTPDLNASSSAAVDGNTSISSSSNNEEDEFKTALSNKKNQVQFYNECVEFVKLLNIASEKIVKLLSSKQVFEVTEAIEFVKLAKQFGVAGSDAGVLEMMKLICCPEESIKNCATKAFEQLYLQANSDAKCPSDLGVQIIKNLSTVVRSMKLSQDDALNMLIKEWIKTSAINSYCIAAMVSLFSMEYPGSTPEDSLPALILFSCVVQSQPKLANEYLDVLVETGLLRGRKKHKNKDLRVVRYVCEILQYASSSHPSKRFPNDDKIFTELYKSIVEHFGASNEPHYLYMVESAITLWFKLAMQPEVLCQKLLAVFHSLLIGDQKRLSKKHNESSRISDISSTTEKEDDKENHGNDIKEESLTRFVFLIGHISLRLCLYLEHDVLEERKNRCKREIKEKAQQKHNAPSSDKGEDEDDELNMAVDVAAANDDALTEEIRLVCENVILFGNGIIAKFVYLPSLILRNESKYPNIRLRSVCSVALGQFMMISNKYCSQNIQFFITMMDKTKDISVKNNLVVLFGELLFRHPNVIEPWISYLYTRLQDPCRDVRLNTLLVISHLITNEMVKVKAQISDVALCIVDSDEEIKETATRLFYELSLKGNTLYNVLPDIISTLSNPDATNPLSEENFQKILRHLIELIQKEKQMELLVEKLCIRLRGSESERQWSDLCFCLSLFSYSERSIRKLIDNFASSFASKLYCPEVQNCLSGIISSANKSSKPGVKEAAAELSGLLDEADNGENDDDRDGFDNNDEHRDRTTSLDDEVEAGDTTARKVSKFKTPRTATRRGSRATSTKKSSKTTTKKARKSDSDEECGSKGTSVRKNSRATGSRRIKSDDDSEDEFVVPPTRAVRSTRRRLVIEQEDDEDGNENDDDDYEEE